MAGSDQHKPRPPILLTAHGVVVSLWLVGQIVRDRWWPLGLLFYVPSVCVALMCVPAAGFCLLRRRRRAVAYALLALLPTSVFLFAETRWLPASNAPSETIRLVHWNIQRGKGGMGHIVAALKARDPDVIVLSDLPPHLNRRRFANSILPGGHAVLMSEMLVVSRAPLSEVARPIDEADITIIRVATELGGRPAHLFAVDLHADLGLPRHPRLTRLVEQMHSHRPLVVVGDLNAPRRSAAIAHVPGYRHAYYAAGAGWPFTWPAPLPLWAVDQCLVSDRARTVRYDLVTTPFSDHRMQVVDLILQPESTP